MFFLRRVVGLSVSTNSEAFMTAVRVEVDQSLVPIGRRGVTARDDEV